MHRTGACRQNLSNFFASGTAIGNMSPVWWVRTLRRVVHPGYRHRMAAARHRGAPERDARELAGTPTTDPYRGSLADPYNVTIPTPAPAARTDTVAADEYQARSRQHQQGAPGPATMAGIIAIALGVTVGLLAMVLLAILGLQDDYGAPDRSFYRGTDSGYVVMALVNFGLALASSLGGLALLTGRLGGRIAMTTAGTGILVLSGFWWLRGDVSAGVPIVIGLLALIMLALSYQRSVTRWLGVLPASQPE